ncbi:MAG: PQQ-binding-like beta-propeller repeat protein [Planctomycetes bacterium]|nr:PQQ-binding-like beta-propeller repeat protein [Planctomycetota bacterium]
MRFRTWELVAGAVGALSAAVLVAAPPAGEPPPAAERRLLAEPARSDVYINDSFEASDALAKAQRLIDAGEWSQAAELLQRTADAFGDRLVRTPRGAYIGIRAHINDWIGGWPEAGVSAYQERFDREADDRIRAAAESAGLEDDLAVFERYFCTRPAAKLADTIGQLALESGDLALARRVYRRALEQHPTAADQAARYRAMLAVIDALEGEPAEGRSAAASADRPSRDAAQESDLGNLRIRWMGEERSLSEALAHGRGTLFPLRQPPAPAGWPMFGGSSARDRRSASRVDELGLLWRFDEFGGAVAHAERGGGEPTPADSADNPRQLSMHPVVDGEFIFVQHDREIVALHRHTGVAAWRYRAEDAGGASRADADEQGPGFDCVTVADGRVYASVPGDALPFYGYESTRTPPELVCLDAQTGRLLWAVSPAAGAEELSEIAFDSAPLVDRGHLFVVGRRRRSFGFEDAYLYRFSAATGTFEFRTHLGSASTGMLGFRRATMAVAALRGDTIYVCTNLGSYAAVSAQTGAVRWLRTYRRDLIGDSFDSTWAARGINAWAYNAVVCSGERLVIRPLDTSYLIVAAADDGRVLQTVTAADLGGAETLLGVDGNTLCVVGGGVACVDLETGAPRWVQALPEGGAYGRGAWVEDRVLVPTRVGISAYTVADGQRQDIPWGAEGRSGNLLPLPEQMIVAAEGNISVYVRKAELWESLRARMAEAPSDPAPALEFAEIALRGGEDAQALTLLDEAVRRAGGFLEPLDGGLKRRLFADILMFTDVLAGRGALSREDLARLFSFASQSAPDPEAHVRYRFRFAEMFERFQDAEQPLRLYHQVLRDRSLREIALPRQAAEPGASPSESAGSAAATRIGQLVERLGAAVYAPYEAEAQRWLDSGRAAEDLGLLTRVVDTFPNSNAAPQALTAQGDALVRLSRFEEAARAYARAYHRYPRNVNRPEVMRKIADAYERGGKTAYAYRWLTKAAREHPGVLVDHDNRWMTFREYRDRLAGVRSRVEVSRPRLELPLERHTTQTFEEGAVLLSPWFADAAAADWSRYYVYTSLGIRAFSTRTSQELWADPAPVRAKAELLVALPQVVVFATAYEVFGIDPVSGNRRWSYGEYPARLVDPNADFEDSGAFRTHALQDELLVSVRDNGGISAIDVAAGDLLWTQTYRPVAFGRVRVSDPWVVYHVVQDGRAVLCHLNAATGAWLGAVATDETRPVEDLHVALDGQVIVVTSQSIAAYDLETGARRWRASFDGQLRQSSLLLDVDALYGSDDGRQVRKISLEDGRTLWRSETISRRPDDEITVDRQGSSVLVSTSTGVSAVDEVTGMTLWHGTVPDEARLVRRMVTESYVVAVHVPDEDAGGDAAAYLYDHRNASGVIPARGGTRKLGVLSELRAIQVGDDALLIQTGSAVQTWTRE